MAEIRTIPEAAAAARVSETTIKRAIEAGVIARDKRGRFDRGKLLAGIAARAARRGGQPMGGGTNGHSGGMPSALIAIKQEQAKEELELTRAKRMKAQQELAKEAGELLVKGDVLRGIGELMLDFRDGLTAVKDQVALRCDMRKAREVSAIVGAAHDELLKRLAEGAGRFTGGFTKI
jgi:hypothetical protein